MPLPIAANASATGYNWENQKHWAFCDLNWWIVLSVWIDPMMDERDDHMAEDHGHTV